MKRRGICLLLVLLLLAGLAACGGGGETAAASDSAASSAGQEAGWAEGGAEAAEQPAADFSAVRQNAKLILSADLALETRDYDKAVADIEQMTAAAGGYIQSSGTSGEPGSRFANSRKELRISWISLKKSRWSSSILSITLIFGKK